MLGLKLGDGRSRLLTQPNSDEFRAIERSKFYPDPTPVRTHRGQTDSQSMSNRIVRKTLRSQNEKLSLTI